jgi:tRNA A-37 threonylcarbamoyl transferase component Bud32
MAVPPPAQRSGDTASLAPKAESSLGMIPPPPADLPPLLAIPEYELLEEVGRGAMGVVYKARQVKLNRVVALKMILAGPFAGEVERARFQTEAEAVGRLQHPNIVQVYEVGEHEGKPFISLEFCPGDSLDKKLNGTPLPPAEAARLVQSLARAVQAAHERHVIHRDLKPANVLMSADGTPKITDFGLAKKLDAAGQTGSGAVLGTPSYMAPEQAGGKTREIGPAADVYALGAILYECLTGRPPFKAATTMETILQVLSDEPVPVRQLQPKTPRDLETICQKCLEKDVGKRYGGVAELAEELRRFSAGEPIAARPLGAVERALKWARRRPAVAAAWVLLVVALGLEVGGGGALRLWRNAEELRRVASAAQADAENSRDALAREKKIAEEALQGKLEAEQQAREILRGKLEAEQQARAAEKRVAEIAQVRIGDFNYIQKQLKQEIALHAAVAFSGFSASRPLGGLATVAAVRHRKRDYDLADLLQRHHRASLELGLFDDAEADFRQLRAAWADTPAMWSSQAWASLHQELWNRPALARLRQNRGGYLTCGPIYPAEVQPFALRPWSSLYPLWPRAAAIRAFQRVCKEMDRRFPEPHDPGTAHTLARTRLLVGDGLDKGDANRLVTLAKFAVDSKVDSKPHSAEYRATYGAALYRAGKLEAAVEQLKIAGEMPGWIDRIWQETFLALAHHRLGEHLEARDALTRAVRQMEAVRQMKWVSRGRGPDWNQRVEWDYLRAEAEATLGWRAPPR